MKRFILFIVALLFFQACGDAEMKKKQPLPEVNVVPILLKDVPLTEDFVGQIYGFVDIPIRARVSGFLEGIHFEEGRRVTKDQLLYSIDPQPYQADVAAQKSKLAEAKTELVRAKNELDRYEELIKTKAVSQSDYDATKAEMEAAESSVQAAQANVELSEINLSYCRMLSPIDGLIGRTNAKVGEFVGKDPNPVILNTVSKISQVRVNFFITESEYLQLARESKRRKEKEALADTVKAVNESATELKLILSDGSMHPHSGRVDFVNREVDAMTGSMLVQASFPNPDRILRPGQYGKVRVQFELVENGMLVPQKSVTELQGQYSLFVVGPDSLAQKKQVTISEQIGDYWLIEEGIDQSDQVIIEGFQMLKSGTKVRPVEVAFKSKAKAN